MKVEKAFYLNTDTPLVAENLLGKILCVQTPEGLCTGRITETEAYVGESDRGCHAYGGKRTPRTEIMYREGGCAYIYWCYGIHAMMNVVTHQTNQPHAILIRAVEPLQGIELMQSRRGVSSLQQLTTGPGKLGQAFGLHPSLSGTALFGNHIWLEHDARFVPGAVVQSPRVGMNFEGFYKTVPWNFRLKASAFTSFAKRSV